MKLTFIILIISLLSCTKQVESLKFNQHCEWIVMLSDKYLLPDTTFLRTDTIYWNGARESKRRLCDSTLNRFKYEASNQSNFFNLCSIGILEKRRFVYIK